MCIKNLCIIVLLVSLTSFKSFAAIYQVGNLKTFKTPNELYRANVIQENDTIEIDAEEYRGQASLAVWYPNNLLIRGVGGRPHLIADGEYIMGKGIWVFAGNNITVENIEFSGAKVPDKNGAGIRLDGTGMTVRNCSFHDNEDGILTSNSYEGDILIEFSEFAGNGFEDGYSHNLYVGHVNSLTFRFNYTHHARVGHTLKSRAQNNFIYYNRIMDEETGYSSRLIDLPNGGLAIIMGNLFMQGINAINSNMVGFGPEGLNNNSPHELYVINNTFVNKRFNSGIFISIKEGTDVAHISNNIFAGAGVIYTGTANTFQNNLEEREIENIKFLDEMNYNYEISGDSPAVDFGVDLIPVHGYSLTPEFEYKHPANFELRNNIDAVDAGAYEFRNITFAKNTTQKQPIIYPNPTTGITTVNWEKDMVKNISVFDVSGKKLFEVTATNSVNLSQLKSGIYILKIELNHNEFIRQTVIKNL